MIIFLLTVITVITVSICIYMIVKVLKELRESFTNDELGDAPVISFKKIERMDLPECVNTWCPVCNDELLENSTLMNVSPIGENRKGIYWIEIRKCDKCKMIFKRTEQNVSEWGTKRK